jgi:hypothetical protein
MTVKQRNLNHSSSIAIRMHYSYENKKNPPSCPHSPSHSVFVCVRSMIKTDTSKFKRRKFYDFTCNWVTEFRIVTSCDMELIQPLWSSPVHERGKTPPLSPRSSLNIDSVVMETSPQPNTTSPGDAYWKIEVWENRTEQKGETVAWLTRTKTYPSFAARPAFSDLCNTPHSQRCRCSRQDQAVGVVDHPVTTSKQQQATQFTP